MSGKTQKISKVSKYGNFSCEITETFKKLPHDIPYEIMHVNGVASPERCKIRRIKGMTLALKNLVEN